ncbi:CFEM domain-containing protein [Cladophialophora immunda]|nr:CFEM domain-containing protein [Cladophialophora immunda]
MHRAIIKLPFLLSAVALARPQTPADTSALSGLPACAQDAANAALASSGCPVNDQNCICGSPPFISAITTAVTQTCSPADVQAALVFGQNFCGAALGAGGSSSSSSAPATDAGDTASSSPTSSPTDSNGSDGVSTTTVSGTLTSMTSVADASDSMTTSAVTVSDSYTSSAIGSGSGTMMTTTQCTTTTTMMTTVASRPTGAYNATYTGGVGAAMKNGGAGMIAAVMGVAGAVALL